MCKENDFNWLAQLRYYWEDNKCMVRIINALMKYANEYLGNSFRWVVTYFWERKKWLMHYEILSKIQLKTHWGKNKIVLLLYLICCKIPILSIKFFFVIKIVIVVRFDPSYKDTYIYVSRWFLDEQFTVYILLFNMSKSYGNLVVCEKYYLLYIYIYLACQFNRQPNMGSDDF